MRKWLKRLCAFLMIVLVMGWLQDIASPFDSFSHFRLLICVALSAVALVLLLLGQRRHVLVSVMVILVSLWLTNPYLPQFGTSVATKAHPNLKIVQFNMRYDNRSTEMALRSLRSRDADLYVFQEVSAANRSIVEAMKNTHPNMMECGVGRFATVVILSRLPYATPAATCARGNTLMLVGVNVGDSAVNVANLHLSWPWPFGQHRRAPKLAPYLEAVKGPVVLVGDFNAAPWSNMVKRVADMLNATVAPGLVHTWSPRFPKFDLPLPPFLALDHAITRDIALMHRETLPFAGSDHLPVLTEFALHP